MTNRLAQSTSPYLLQHQDNPVDWWPWCPEAFAEARERDVPVLLSIGYAACHWCHVMAHESFEDAATAKVMNEGYVCIKVDREERPDVDAVYMDAVQALTGHGGWPLTAFLTPDGAPFFAGTYFPPEPRHGMPAFTQLLESVSVAWAERRTDLVAAGAEVLTQLQLRTDSLSSSEGSSPPDADALDAAVATALETEDVHYGAFQGAPKFPPHHVLELMLRHHARTGDPASLAFVRLCCERMARGGIYDQLAGGFSRYSVDNRWEVPHFEKMLYDNAQLARSYLHLWRATGDPLARRIALETAEWLVRDLRTPEGGFASALDADTDGVEGLTYAWTPAQLAEVAGEEDGARLAELLGVTEEGTFEHGSSVLQLPVDPEDQGWWDAWRTTLLQARAQRPQPGRDDKVVTAWNGLAIAALAEVGALLDRPDLLQASIDAAELVTRVHLVEGRLRRVSRDGAPGADAGVLEDYADLAEGLLALHQVTGTARWCALASDLLEVILTRFDDGASGFFDTADDAERLVLRPQDDNDNATPSGQSAAAGALLTYAALTGSARHRTAAEGVLSRLSGLITGHARFAGWAAAVAEARVAGPLEIAVLGRPDLERVARLTTSPGAVVLAGTVDPGGTVEAPSPLLADRPGGAAYVCQGFVCDAPIDDPAQLAERLGVAPAHLS